MTQGPIRTKMGAAMRAMVDAVAIGRNEGDRLIACLESLQGRVRRVIYVDSGSTDGSVEAARARGAQVVALDMAQPFTAARARNAGLAELADDPPDFVQFIDGDCALRDGWLDAALGFMADHPDVAVVCGRRRERFPDASIYNRLCDQEWNTPVGEATSCGGDSLMRYGPLSAVGGFREDLIAGEEPELCLRLRRAEHRIWRIDTEMTWHDAAILSFRQWWKRVERTGYAYAEGAARFDGKGERYRAREIRRALYWGIVLPVVSLALAVLISPWALALLLAYPAQMLRLMPRLGRDMAVFVTLAKFPEAAGAFRYQIRKILGRDGRLIEYK